MKTLNKLKSRAGASVTIALLLLLVCLVIGSVVLTAGAASAGRFSELAQSDERFYCVDSAVTALTRIIEDAQPSVSLLKTDETTVETVITADGSRTSQPPAVSTVYGAEDAPADPTVFDELLRRIRVGVGAVDSDVWENGAADAGFSFTKQFSVVPRTADSELGSLRADVTLTADKNGDLTVTVSSGGSGDKYTAVLTFSADVNEVLSTEGRSSQTTYRNDADDNTVETTTVTETTRKTVRLNFKRTGVS